MDFILLSTPLPTKRLRKPSEHEDTKDSVETGPKLIELRKADKSVTKVEKTVDPPSEDESSSALEQPKKVKLVL